MKITRLITYEGTEEALRTVLARAMPTGLRLNPGYSIDIKTLQSDIDDMDRMDANDVKSLAAMNEADVDLLERVLAWRLPCEHPRTSIAKHGAKKAGEGII